MRKRTHAAILVVVVISIALLIVAIVAAAAAGRPAATIRRPWLTVVACVLLVICLIAQVNLPDLLPRMLRDGSAIRAGQVYRLFTALWFQDGGIVGGSFNIAMLAMLGAIAEQVLSRTACLGIYLIGGLLSEVVALAWQPLGAGNSVAYMSLAGVLLGLALYQRRSRARAIIAGLGLIAGVLLCLRADIHGAAVVIGCALLPLALRNSPSGHATSQTAS